MKISTSNVRDCLRSRNFAFLVYPESVPKDWLDRLENICVPSLVSPLHSADEEHCKPHFHVLLHFDNLKSVRQIEELVRWSFGHVVLSDGIHFAVNHVEIVQNFSSYVRYLIHFDNPDKEQFISTSDFNPWDEYILTFHFDRSRLAEFFICGGLPPELFDIIQYVRENNVKFFADLVDYSMFNQPNWLHSIMSNQRFILEYIKSFTFKCSKVNQYVNEDSVPVTIDNHTILF